MNNQCGTKKINPWKDILDVGCAKGFLLRDFRELMPEAHLAGLDVSTYAIEHSEECVRDHLVAGCASSLPYADDSFDLVLSINTIHNLSRPLCQKALQEIMRVSRGSAFVTVDAWRTPQEHRRLLSWMLTARTFMSVSDWQRFFAEAGYTGDYYWFFA